MIPNLCISAPTNGDRLAGHRGPDWVPSFHLPAPRPPPPPLILGADPGFPLLAVEKLCRCKNFRTNVFLMVGFAVVMKTNLSMGLVKCPRCSKIRLSSRASLRQPSRLASTRTLGRTRRRHRTDCLVGPGANPGVLKGVDLSTSRLYWRYSGGLVLHSIDTLDRGGPAPDTSLSSNIRDKISNG